jgi:hypothetical protein
VERRGLEDELRKEEGERLREKQERGLHCWSTGYKASLSSPSSFPTFQGPTISGGPELRFLGYQTYRV